MGLGEPVVRPHYGERPRKEVLGVGAQVVAESRRDVVGFTDIGELAARPIRIRSLEDVDTGPAAFGSVQQLGDARTWGGEKLSGPGISLPCSREPPGPSMSTSLFVPPSISACASF